MKLDYTIKYSDRRTIGLSVERDKNIVVRAPIGARSDQIDDFVNRKKFWLYTKLKHPQKYAKTAKTEFVSGASISYLGRNYKLDVVKEEFPGIKFSGKFILPESKREEAAEILRTWYIQKAKEKIAPRVKRFADNLGVNYANVKISNMKYRWGSCTTKNNLNFNWRLIKAPLPVIDYIIVHELAHLIEPNHTPRFWNIIKVQIPKYRQAKEWLKENGSILEIDF